MAKRKTVLSVLRNARELVAHGWCQVEMHNAAGGNHQYCAFGAIKRASGRDEVLMLDAVVVMKSCLTGGSASVMLWNDAISRTQKQVVAAFDRAIRRLEKST